MKTGTTDWNFETNEKRIRFLDGEPLGGNGIKLSGKTSQPMYNFQQRSLFPLICLWAVHHCQLIHLFGIQFL
jgi:hypothetical protein